MFLDSRVQIVTIQFWVKMTQCTRASMTEVVNEMLDQNSFEPHDALGDGIEQCSVLASLPTYYLSPYNSNNN